MGRLDLERCTRTGAHSIRPVAVLALTTGAGDGTRTAFFDSISVNRPTVADGGFAFEAGVQSTLPLLTLCGVLALTIGVAQAALRRGRTRRAAERA